MLLMQMNLFGSMMSMKKYTLIAAMAAMAILAGSCAKEQDRQSDKPFALDQNLVKMHFTARTEGSPTKTTLNTSTGAVSWAAGDAIKMVWELDGVEGSSVSDDLSAGNISAGKAEFTAEVPDKFTMTEGDYKDAGGTSLHLYAVYPSSIVTDYSDASKFYLTVPNVQDGSFEHASIALAKWDKNNPSSALEFKNLCGLLQIVIADNDVRKIILHSSDYIAGKMQVSFTGPTVVAVNAGEKAITVNVPGAGTYYVAVLPTDDAKGIGVNSLYVELLDSSDDLIGDKSTINPLVIARRQIRKLGTIETSFSDRLYFKSDGTGAGTSWDDAAGVSTLIATMQSGTAITKDLYLAAGDYVIANQTMKPASGTTLKIMGGYPSDASGKSLSGRDIQNNVTTIKNTSGRTFNTQMGNWIFDGLTFTSTGYSSPSAPGCALLLLAGTQSATVNDCTFTGSSHGGSQGGAVRVACAATFNNCAFTSNTATAGNAGAIWVTDAGTLTAIGCLFQDNSTSAASKCGGAIFNNGGAVRLTDCSFIDNMANASGGYGGAITSFNGSVFVDRCYFRASKGLVKIGGHHIDMRSGTLGVNNCVFTGPFGQGVNQINNAGGSPQPMYIANTVFNSQQSAALIANAGAGVIVNSIMINSASSGNGLSVSNTGTLNLNYTLYNKAEEGEGKVAPVATSCVAGIQGNTGGTAFPTWYKTNSSTMNSNDQTSTSTVSDARGSVHYFVWNGTIPSGLGTITMPSITEVKAALGSSAFLTWLGDANLSVDIRGMARDTDAMWPGSYQGTGTKASIESLNVR